MEVKSADTANYERDLLTDPRLADLILARPDIFPSAQDEPDRIIRCSAENADRAICRALARGLISLEVWRVQVVDEP